MTDSPKIRWMTAFLDLPQEVADAGVEYWQEVTASTPSAWRGDHQFVTLRPKAGDAYLRVQASRLGPPGCHLDLHVEDVIAASEAAEALDASIVFTEPGLVVLRSPDGMPFCFVDHDGEARRPAPARWSSGHRSLVDQLCLDIPPARYDAECAFWAGLTGWQAKSASSHEFRYLVRPSGMPLRLLLQRLDDVPAGGSTTAHLDLASDSVAAEATRHEALGATVVRRRDAWVTLRDIAGLEYCITGRDPGTGLRPQA